MIETKRLHIGFITMEFPHSTTGSSGGLGTSIKNLTQALVTAGHKVSVFIIYQDKDAIIDDNGVRLHKIRHKQFTTLNWFFYRLWVSRQINRQCKSNDIDILEAPDWTGITAFMRFKVPLVIRFHGSDTYFCHLEKRPQKWKNRFIERHALKATNYFIAPTAFAGELTKELFQLSTESIKTIHYGLVLKNFINDNPSSFSRNTILYIGTVIRKKGVLELAKIFNLLIQTHPKTKLILIGPDSSDSVTGSKSTYKLFTSLLSTKASQQVSYLGKVPYVDVQQYIKSAQICVFPSFAETLGMVTIEAMALQKVVVNTNMGWAESLIDNGENGYLIHPKNHEAYAERIGNLLDDIPKCLAIGKAARLKVNLQFDMTIQVKKNIKFYSKVLNL
jgi:glycosyltransferase involved in cell wall biosynthesis